MIAAVLLLALAATAQALPSSELSPPHGRTSKALSASALLCTAIAIKDAGVKMQPVLVESIATYESVRNQVLAALSKCDTSPTPEAVSCVLESILGACRNEDLQKTVADIASIVNEFVDTMNNKCLKQ